MGKRKRVPEVLWRMFGNRARTLSEAIISLIPQHCDCNGRGKCLRCVFGVGDEAAMAYLIRPDDLQEYRQLMMKCFVVIPTDTPPLPPLLSFSLRWSQPQVFLFLSCPPPKKKGGKRGGSLHFLTDVIYLFATGKTGFSCTC